MDSRRVRNGLRMTFSVAAIVLLAGSFGIASVSVSPPEVELDTPESSQQLLVTQTDGTRSLDLTRSVTYESVDPQIAAVDPQGLIVPRGEGTTHIRIRTPEATLEVPVKVTGLLHPTPISFEQQIIPILTKAGCNAGGCHGKAEGQNGFKLSVFGYDAASDYDAVAREGRGRRVFPSSPAQSLLLQKGAAEVPHGGGRKLEVGGLWHRRLVRWIHEGTPYSSPEVAPVVAVKVEPAEQVLLAGGTQQLRVTAIDASGKARCVTTEAEFSSNAESIATVDPRGWIQASDIPGEAAILVRYMGQVAICRVTLPRHGVEFTRPPEQNFIDGHVWNKLTRLGIAPSELADDDEFLRRVYLDTIGTLPTPEEALRFLTDSTPNKRQVLIDQLLERDEYADYWTLRWADILRVDRDAITPAGAVAITRWLRRQIAENRPYNELIRDLLTAQGSTTAEGPAAFYRAVKTPEELSRSISQLFLGVRIECAQCHHHPFEKWGQDDYFALAGFFTGVTRKKLPTGAEAVFSRGGSDLKHPRTGELVPTRGLGAPAADFSDVTDRRSVLADWMTAPENEFFARAIANRLWAHYFGRGLVEPVDDIRATNPATNEPLLEALTAHLREVNYDLKAFTRALLNSRVYQLSAATNASNVDDEMNFSHMRYKVLPAEVLLDAICDATEVPEKFEGWPAGYRAIQVWDNRMPSYFFRVFGRPVRASVCECERSSEPSISQALHLMSSDEIAGKIRDRKGRARRLANSATPLGTAVEELFLATLSRLPTEEERTLIRETFGEGEVDRRAYLEDVLWMLLNSKEFIYNH